MDCSMWLNVDQSTSNSSVQAAWIQLQRYACSYIHTYVYTHVTCTEVWVNMLMIRVLQLFHWILTCTDASGFLESYFGPSVNAPGFSLFQCTGTEQSLTDCPHSAAADCSLYQLAGVRCTGSVGPCQSAGYVECCTSSNCTVATSNGSCDCNTDCHTNNTCCSDINTICPLNSKQNVTYNVNGKLCIAQFFEHSV